MASSKNLSILLIIIGLIVAVGDLLIFYQYWYANAPLLSGVQAMNLFLISCHTSPCSGTGCAAAFTCSPN
ncbi:MAG: hypothetical protein KGH67_06185, partial [Candidatus Micrarchaeota archaeon]|nr:hypothetical protein [Candidatus Micrarchaeota archaeon]